MVFKMFFACVEKIIQITRVVQVAEKIAIRKTYFVS